MKASWEDIIQVVLMVGGFIVACGTPFVFSKNGFVFSKNGEITGIAALAFFVGCAMMVISAMWMAYRRKL
jgi:hypothetical protein